MAWTKIETEREKLWEFRNFSRCGKTPTLHPRSETSQGGQAASSIGRLRLGILSVPDLFYKGRSQEKNLSLGRKFSCFPAHLIEQDLFLTGRTMCSVVGHSGPAVWVFSTSGFHRLSATKH